MDLKYSLYFVFFFKRHVTIYFAYPLVNGSVEYHQSKKGKQVTNKEIHPVDVNGDIQVVASQVRRIYAVYSNIVLPMNFRIVIYLPKSVKKIKRMYFILAV